MCPNALTSQESDIPPVQLGPNKLSLAQVSQAVPPNPSCKTPRGGDVRLSMMGVTREALCFLLVAWSVLISQTYLPPGLFDTPPLCFPFTRCCFCVISVPQSPHHFFFYSESRRKRLCSSKDIKSEQMGTTHFTIISPQGDMKTLSVLHGRRQPSSVVFRRVSLCFNQRLETCKKAFSWDTKGILQWQTPCLATGGVVVIISHNRF